MKKVILFSALVCVAVACIYAAQDSALSIRQVRDPVQLKDALNANALDAETRIAAVEAAGVGGTLAPGSLIVGNDSSNATAMAVTGDVTVTQDGTNLTTALAADCVAAAEMADADHGDVSWSSGVATVDSGAVLASEIGAGTLANTVLLPSSVTWTNTKSIVIDGTTAVTTNQTFLSATDVTNTLVIVDGLIKAVQ